MGISRKLRVIKRNRQRRERFDSNNMNEESGPRTLDLTIESL